MQLTLSGVFLPDTVISLHINSADTIQGYWTNLAKKLDPNAAPLLDWPSFSSDNDLRMNFSLTPSTVPNFRSDKCKFWQGVYDAQFATM